MRIDKIHIDSFMGKNDFTLEFTGGINVIRGDNESGKSSVAEFIKFMLYGASARGVDGEISERQRYLSFGKSSFGGQMELRTSGGRYRIDRSLNLAANGFRESLSVTDLDKMAPVLKGENVGEALLGIPEEVFEKAVYISQEKEAKTGGAGLGSAIENLLFAADETVSTDKALKKLDALRVSLLHKNGKGGQLFALASERESLEARLVKAMSDNSEIIAKESSLLETDTRIAEKKTEYNQCKKLCQLYDNYLAYNRFKKTDELSEKWRVATNARKALEESFDGFSPDGEYLGRLRAAAEQLQDAVNDRITSQKSLGNAIEARAAAENVVVSESDGSLEKVAKKAAKSEKLARIFKILGIVLIALAPIGAGAVYLCRLSTPLYAAAGASALIGILLLVFAKIMTSKLANTLSDYGVSHAYALFDKLREEEEARIRTAEALAKARADESAAEALFGAAAEREALFRADFEREAKRLGESADNSEALFSTVENYISERERLISEQKLLSERISALESENAAYDRATVEKTLEAIKDLSVFEKLDITEYSRNRDFCENAIAALEIKKSDLEKSLAALHATVESSALISAALDEVKKKEKAAKAKYDAASLAIRSIENASKGLRTRISPHLAEYAGKLLSVLTSGKYTEIGVDDEMNMTFLSKDGAHDIAYLSKGTRESAYFALRLALCDLVSKEEKLPLVLDESFAHSDNERTKQCFRVLAALSEGGTQSFVFACHDREEKIAEKVSVINLIEI